MAGAAAAASARPVGSGKRSDLRSRYDVTEEEIEILDQLRTAVMTDFGADTFFPDRELFLFLCAAKWKVPAAIERLQRFVSIGKRTGFHKPIVSAELLWVLSVGLLKAYPRTDECPAMLVFDPSKFFPATMPVDPIIRTLKHLLYILLEDEKSAREGIIMIGMLGNAGYSNFDRSAQGQIISSLRHCFPVRIQQIVLVDPPFLVRSVLTLMSPFLGAKLRSKIKRLPTSSIPTIIPRAAIPQPLGGNRMFQANLFIRDVSDPENLPRTEADIQRQLELAAEQPPPK